MQGLERLVVTNCASKMLREKIEKIALDLVKLENEQFSIPALKLLVSCMYIGKMIRILYTLTLHTPQVNSNRMAPPLPQSNFAHNTNANPSYSQQKMYINIYIIIISNTRV